VRPAGGRLATDGGDVVTQPPDPAAPGHEPHDPSSAPLPPPPPPSPYGSQPQQPQQPPAAPPPPPYGSYQPPPPYGQPASQPYGQPASQPYGQQYGEPYGAPAVGVPAGFGRRVLGRLVDAVIGVVVITVVTLPLSHQAVGVRLGANVVTYAIWAAYEILLVGSRGQTLGMMAAGMRVVNADTGGPVEYGPAAIRWLVLAAGFFFCFVPGVVVCLSPLFDSSGRQQGWHDKASRTIAVRA
jgi:uncharacterized RDD family membrane protein YckC